MKLDNFKLAEVFVKSGMKKEQAEPLSLDLYKNSEKVMFRAILWGYAKFGSRATYDESLITETMDDGRLNEFQAIAKLVYQSHKK